MKVIVAYVPVLHRGYRDFFASEKADKLYIFGPELIREFDYLRKDVRALNPDDAKVALEKWGFFKEIIAADASNLAKIEKNDLVIMPDEDESRKIVEKYLRGHRVEFRNIFLRWDSKKIIEEKQVNYERAVSYEGLVKEMMDKAIEESKKATNLWRQVGAVVARDGNVLVVGFNRQVPDQHTPYYEGDARMFFKKGLNIGLTTDQHAESVIISEAARKGIALEGADLYISTFPCPPCAKIIAASGIKRCYFSTGYAMLDGERILKDFGVEIIQVTQP